MVSSMKAEGHPTLAVVVWDDAWSGGNDLITLKDVEEKHRPSVMQTLGWVLKDDPAGVFVANERCMDLGDECYRGSTFIPRSLIRSVTPFKLQTPRKTRPANEKVPAEPPGSPDV
jgi:hypothetical protein